MWSDNSTDTDFLNFECVAKTTADLIATANGHPLSIGISGGWGVGKSSMLSLISKELKATDPNPYVFVDFNAWLYQGYDDARAALLDVIARTLVAHAEKNKTGLDKARDFLRRVNWLRVTGVVAGAAASMALGVPPSGLAGAAISLGKGLLGKCATDDEKKEAQDAGKTIAESADSLISPEPSTSPPQQIQDVRDYFRDTLKEMGVTLVVFIDDLDRCLPSTSIATLEAIRLFLFIHNTAFVIAADDRMIRQAVRAHFHGTELDDDLVTNYFDKLIQIPIRVPPLGIQDVRAYMMMLFIDKSPLEQGRKDQIRIDVCKQLSNSWNGKRVDSSFMDGLIKDCSEDVRKNIGIADRLSPLMATSQQIAGNPRLIKQFLNTLSIRKSIALRHGVPIDESVLAKMLLFERCASTEARAYLLEKLGETDNGRPAFLKEWESKAIAGDKIADLPPAWNAPFITDWLGLEPPLADCDLRGIIYVSREHLSIVSPSDRLSSQAAIVMQALLELTRTCPAPLLAKAKELPGREHVLIMDRLLVRARQETTWGIPSVLFAMLAICDTDVACVPKAAAFFQGLSGERIKADIIEALRDRPWAREAILKWGRDPSISPTAKKAIGDLTQTRR